MDQRYWAACCQELGCGCEGIPIDSALVRSSDEEPPKIVDLVKQALDRRSSGNRSMWSENAKELKERLISTSSTDADGVAVNAEYIFKGGVDDARVVRRVYAAQLGCGQETLRQQKCCCICWIDCIGWFFCMALPRLFLLQYMLARWLLCGGAFKFLIRRCKAVCGQKIVIPPVES